jgi:hypothetical protein
MKLKAIRAHYVAGEVMAVGATYEVADALGLQLVGAGKAVPLQPGQAVKPQRMTTKTAGPLVGGQEGD